jgi:ABC-type transporter Mla MlaB component
MGAPAQTFSLAIRGPIARDDLPRLRERVDAILREGSGKGVVLCDVHGVSADAVAVDLLCRLQVAARRYGCEVHLRRVSDELRSLIGFMGLSEVLPGEDGESPCADRPLDRAPLP